MVTAANLSVIPVCWLSLHDVTPPRGYWAQEIFEDLFSGTLHRPPAPFTFVHVNGLDDLRLSGGVVVIPSDHHAVPDDVEILKRLIAELPWALVILSGDEGMTFPFDSFSHLPNVIEWRQIPDIGFGYTPGTVDTLRRYPSLTRTLNWSFAGQVTHDERDKMAKVLTPLPDGEIHPTDTFAAGLDHADYLHLLARSRLAPCPSGPVCPDSFRFWEALEAGCVPVVAGPSSPGYWGNLDAPPIPHLESWDAWDSAELLADYPASANRAGAWWTWRKRQLATLLHDKVAQLSSITPSPALPDDSITVLIPTSPIPSHPSTDIIHSTLSSIRDSLPHAEIFILCDGIRPEQSGYREAYESYQAELLDLIRRQFSNVTVFRHESHQHQANMTQQALSHIRTPYLLFIEHDTPLINFHGDIPWASLITLLDSDIANLIRLHYDHQIHPEHEHMMRGPIERFGDVWMRPTNQWSQRPHLSRVSYYRDILDAYFDLPTQRTFIEDWMHSVCEVAGNDGQWDEHKLWIYTPPGNYQRSYHLDGRAGDQKWVVG